MKLKTHHLNWLPCELEALAIASAVKHFSPYIRESKYPLQILSDNKSCVQAFSKLRKGHFSASARVSTFLSCLSEHNVIMCHLKGENNKSSDYGSRKPQICIDSSCQICKFVEEISESVVNAVTVTDILSGAVRMPFLNKAAWRTAQHDCPSLRRVYAHLSQGTRPSRKAKHITDVKRYLDICSIDQHGLIIVRKPDQFLHHKELIVVPKDVVPGLVTALHIQFNHATKHQLSKLFDRFFYAISSSKTIEEMVNSCMQCNSLKVLHREMFQQSSSPSPTKPGMQFASDIIERAQQKIFTTRDIHTSYTTASIISDQTTDTLRSAILEGTSMVRLPSCTMRVDNAPGFLSLKDDKQLASHGIKLEFGRIKNVNKNPVAERNNQELELELLRVDPSGSPVSSNTLCEAVKALNLRIRNRGLSAQEILFCRDQVTGQQLQFEDQHLSDRQECIRQDNHASSSSSKAHGARAAVDVDVIKGDLVYIKSDGSKSRSRELYMVMDINGDIATLQKINNSKFMSRRYDVPLSHLFHATKKGNITAVHPSGNISSSSDESDEQIDNASLHSGSNTSSDNDDSDEYVQPPTDNVPPAGDDQQLPRRSARIRDEPPWLRRGPWIR